MSVPSSRLALEFHARVERAYNRLTGEGVTRMPGLAEQMLREALQGFAADVKLEAMGAVVAEGVATEAERQRSQQELFMDALYGRKRLVPEPMATLSIPLDYQP